MEEKKKVIWTGIVFVLLVAAVIVIFYLATHKKSPEVQKAPEIIEKKPMELPEQETAGEEPVEPIDISLEESDEFIRDIVREISSDPQISEWMKIDHIIKKFVAAVDNIANGLSPRKQIEFFEPKGEFLAKKKGEKYIIDEDSYKRYNPVANAFNSIKTKDTVKLYRRYEPLIQEAYKELGYPENDFNVTLNRAIKELLAVPVIEGDIVLISKLKSFELEDSELEEMSQAQKHLFRMGPENIKKVQQKLREFQNELNL
ncbi:MAG: DUF3014 domain-containing protein [Acidobacteriota bacterium]